MSKSLHPVVKLAAVGLAFLAAPCLASSVRCSSYLVIEGDTAGKLRSRCGEPTEVSRSTKLTSPVVWFNGRPMRVGYEAVVVPVETWTYNFGPNRLIHRVRIEDGVVVAIDTLGYGYP
jgi:hypothetical protein